MQILEAGSKRHLAAPAPSWQQQRAATASSPGPLDCLPKLSHYQINIVVSIFGHAEPLNGWSEVSSSVIVGFNSPARPMGRGGERTSVPITRQEEVPGMI